MVNRLVVNLAHTPSLSTVVSAICLAIPLLSFSVPVLPASQEWTLERDEDRIKLFTRSEPGSPFLAVKVTTLIDAPVEKVVAVLGRGDDCGEWRAMCKSSEVLDTVSDTENYVYLVLDLPWPVSDRDMVIYSKAHIDTEAQTVTVDLEAASSHYPQQDIVRAESNGQYQIKVLNDKQVEFTYIMHTDLGGDLSPGIINPRLAASTYDDVKRLQELAEKE